MDLGKALAELRAQRDAVDEAILSLERLASGRPRGPGRPPGRTSPHARKRPAATPPVSAERVKTASE